MKNDLLNDEKMNIIIIIITKTYKAPLTGAQQRDTSLHQRASSRWKANCLHVTTDSYQLMNLSLHLIGCLQNCKMLHLKTLSLS